MCNLTDHDKKEIENLKEFKEWYIWYCSLSNEEKQEYLNNRWKERN